MVEQTNLTNDQCLALKDYLLERLEDGHLKWGAIKEAAVNFFRYSWNSFPTMEMMDGGTCRKPTWDMGCDKCEKFSGKAP